MDRYTAVFTCLSLFAESPDRGLNEVRQTAARLGRHATETLALQYAHCVGIEKEELLNV